MSLDDSTLSPIEPSKLEAQKEQPEKKIDPAALVGGLYVNVVNQLSDIVSTVKEKIQAKSASAPIEKIFVPSQETVVNMKHAPLPLSMGAQESLADNKKKADALATALQSTLKSLKDLSSLQMQLSSLLHDVSNKSALTKGEMETFNKLQADFTAVCSTIELGLKQLPPNESLTNEINKLLLQTEKEIPKTIDISAIPEWTQFATNLHTQIVANPDNAMGAVHHLSNNLGVHLEEGEKSVEAGSDEPYTGIAGEIEKWIFGAMMQGVYGKIQYFQSGISRNANFLDILGPMEESNIAGIGKGLPKTLEHLPPTPLNQHTASWAKFWKALRTFVKNDHFATWKDNMEKDIAKLSLVAKDPVPDPKLISLLNGIKAKFNKALSGIAFLSKIYQGANWYLFSLKGDTFNPYLKPGMRNKFASMIKEWQDFSATLKNVGGTVQSTNAADQSRLQLELNFMQEFMQAGPSIIQTLKGLMSAITANMKGS